jgi:hypothetical protein
MPNYWNLILTSGPGFAVATRPVEFLLFVDWSLDLQGTVLFHVSAKRKLNRFTQTADFYTVHERGLCGDYLRAKAGATGREGQKLHQ